MAENGIQPFPVQISQMFRMELEAPTERRSRERLKYLVNILRRRSPLEQGYRRRADYNVILAEIPLQLKPVIPPPSGFQSFRHDFKHNNLVMDRLAAARRCALGRRAGEGRQTPEPRCEVLPDGGICFRAERPAAVVVEGKEYLDQMHANIQ